MNLGQAAAVCLYELAARSRFHPLQNPKSPKAELLQTPKPIPLEALKAAPASGNLDILADLIEQVMDRRKLLPKIDAGSQPARPASDVAPYCT